MLPLPEVIRLSLLETARLSDEKLLKRTHGDILASLEGPSDARVGRYPCSVCGGCIKGEFKLAPMSCSERKHSARSS